MTHKYVNPDEFCYFNNHIVWYSPVFEVFKMGCDISVGQGTEFIRPDIVESQSQPLFFDSPFICFRTELWCEKSIIKIFHECKNNQALDSFFQKTHNIAMQQKLHKIRFS